MLPNEYQELAQRTICPQGTAITDRLRCPHDTQLIHASIGLSGEVGEFCTALQRVYFYGKEVDLTNLKEELGDMLWYIAEACEALDYNMEDVMAANIAKLRQRYPHKYTDWHAAEENRDRVAEAKAIDDGVGPWTEEELDEQHKQHMAEVDAKLKQTVKEIDEGAGGDHEERIRSLEDTLEKALTKQNEVNLEMVKTLKSLALSFSVKNKETMTPAEWVTKTLNDRPPTALCPACRNPLSDELVRKLKAPEFAKQAFMCPGCMEVLLTKGLIYV